MKKMHSLFLIELFARAIISMVAIAFIGKFVFTTNGFEDQIRMWIIVIGLMLWLLIPVLKLKQEKVKVVK
ncbi:hypothetical protein LCGC14_2826430 [marine sediment metagenome]|uniref:Uncharacterized protein n=1 Tax=marine sediment metagenome TaxID=412755 RepID=A0A0F8Z229_9ZZZZ